MASEDYSPLAGDGADGEKDDQDEELIAAAEGASSVAAEDDGVGSKCDTKESLAETEVLAEGTSTTDWGTMFLNRYTADDPDYAAIMDGFSKPPCIHPWFSKPKRNFDYVNRRRDWRDNDNRSGDSNRYQGGRDRDGNNSYRGGRDRDNNSYRGGRGRDDNRRNDYRRDDRGGYGRDNRRGGGGGGYGGGGGGDRYTSYPGRK
uniref:Uncharacterized protein n=1 Tax=Plectus sambesii TaxID=2011161 RepID=A0A914W7D9_9BILA